MIKDLKSNVTINDNELGAQGRSDDDGIILILPVGLLQCTRNTTKRSR
jgi:hypothetical protein